MVHHQARIDMLQLEQSRLAAEFAASRQWDEEGFNSAYDWIRLNCKVPGHVAGNYLAVGAHMAELEKSVQGVLRDEISYAHLAVMAHTAEAVGKAFDETKLLALAREHSPGPISSAFTTVTRWTPRSTQTNRTTSRPTTTSR